MDESTLMTLTAMLWDVLGFALKTGALVLGVAVVILLAAWLGQMKSTQPQLKIENWTEKLRHIRDLMRHEVLDAKTLKKLKKSEKEKQKEEAAKKLPRCFILQFQGDIKASAVENLKNEVNAILTVAEPGDEVVALIESPGGVVHGYGLAAAELIRLRNKDLKLQVCIDQIGASGGYMMACVAHKIYSAPFAIIGSIGVLSQVPNFNRLLKKHDVDYKEYTAGEYKTTVSLLGEITPEKERKFLEMIQGTHDLFKNHVKQYRPQVNLSQVATGEYWYGTQALALGLVDEIRTSQDLLFSKLETHHMVSVKTEKKKNLSEKLMGPVSMWLKSSTTLASPHPWDQIH